MMKILENRTEEDHKISSSTMIGLGTTIDGSIDTPGNIRIEGSVLGGVTSKAKVALGVKSKVRGGVVALNADIEGEVYGNLEIQETLVLKKTAEIKGDIYSKKLIIEFGASFNGRCVMGEREAQTKMTDSSKAFYSLIDASRKL